jgi:hypothetical protein
MLFDFIAAMTSEKSLSESLILVLFYVWKMDKSLSPCQRWTKNLNQTKKSDFPKKSGTKIRFNEFQEFEQYKLLNNNKLQEMIQDFQSLFQFLETANDWFIVSYKQFFKISRFQGV